MEPVIGSFQELVPLGKSKEHQSFRQLVDMTPSPITRRAPSYSDSFLFKKRNDGNSLQSLVRVGSYAPPTLSPILSPGQRSPLHIAVEETHIARASVAAVPARHWIADKIVSFLFHIGLISLFETIFFFYFVSASENSGILKIIAKYVNEAEQACMGWSTNQTQIINDILQVFVNTTDVGLYAAEDDAVRNAYNNQLYRQAWAYVGGLAGCLVCIAVLFWKKGWIGRADGKKIVGENIGLVCMLGLYEFLFFRTIVYQYDSISVGEIDEYVIQALQGSCGLFSRRV